MRVAIGSDDACALSTELVKELARRGDEVVAVHPGAEWPEVGQGVASAVAAGEVDVGVVMCFTGTGVSIAANKVRGARAALCSDVETARGARRWNDANVLALSIRATGLDLGKEILEAFLETEPADSERAAIARVEPSASPP